MTDPKDIYGQSSSAEGFWADEGTSAYYAKNSEELAGRYESGPSPLDAVARYLPAEGRALDVGCGTGRDVCRLEKLGLDSFGTEPSGEMRERARSLHPELKDRLFSAGLPGLEGCGDSYDIIICSAVLQHLPASMLFDSIFAMKHLLKVEGLLILSLPLCYPGVDADTGRDLSGRLFFLRPIEEYLFLAERIGFALVEQLESDDALNREGIVWEHLILRTCAGNGQRPIERIESILRNDRKTNSYKLALLRALGDIAVSTPHAAMWRGDGYVSLSADYVAEKWLEYYWPIVASPDFILQGQRTGGKSDICFRNELKQLANTWNDRKGGLQAFRQAWHQGRLDPETSRAVKVLLEKIRKGIYQPVRYAGTSEKVFRREGRSILIENQLWREFSLMGRWFEDSIIMRWARFTEGLKHQSGGVTAHAVIGLMLSALEEKRDVRHARTVYGSMEIPGCTWSGMAFPAKGGFDVDHAIPFSLWHNNELWNLLPVHPKVNNKKRDKLPTRRLLISRRNVIRNAWELLYRYYPSHFALEAGRLSGHSGFSGKRTDFENLFHSFSEAVETTALQRGVKRWEPDAG